MLVSLTTLLSLIPALSAFPTNAAPIYSIQRRTDAITTLTELEAALTTLETSLPEIFSNSTEVIEILISFFSSITTSSSPTTIPELLSAITNIYAIPPSPITGDDLFGFAEMALAGILPSNFSEQFITPTNSDSNNSYNNSNPINPNVTIYPSKSSGDAPFSVPEATLRAAIKIPHTFEYGKKGKQPVVLVHGTGQTGGVNFLPNMAKLLGSTSYADPVWLNIPSMLNQDAQVSAEYIAYALNYISGISSCPANKIAVLAWSQGNADTQWALKYWPSAREVVSDFLSISPDFRGTYEVLICPGYPLIPCDPGPSQQINTSNFVTTLRSNGGDASLVPTTVIYSETDESVQPQPSSSAASSYLLDTNKIGVSNSRLQDVCKGQVAGGVVTHSGVLFNALTWALVEDALLHEGPGNVARIDLKTVCGQTAAKGLTFENVLATQILLAEAFVNILEYPVKVTVEPPIKAYAA